MTNRQPTDREMLDVLKPLSDRWRHALNLMMAAGEHRTDLPADHREECEAKLARTFGQELRRKNVPEAMIEPMITAIKKMVAIDDEESYRRRT